MRCFLPLRPPAMAEALEALFSSWIFLDVLLASAAMRGMGAL